MKIDIKDRKILLLLEQNARISHSKIGSILKLPKQVVSYRIDRLIKADIIRGFRVVVDLHRLGYFNYRFYLRFQNTDPKTERNLYDKLVSLENLIWAISLTGRWDLELVFVARNNVHFASLLSSFKKEFGYFIAELQVSHSVVNYHFPRKYLWASNQKIPPPLPAYGFEPKREFIDMVDCKILTLLSQDSSISLVNLGNNLGLTYNGVKKRLKKLQTKGIIQFYRIWLNFQKLNRHYFKVRISLNTLDEKIEKSIISFCNLNNSIVYLIFCTDKYDVELEVEAESEEHFREILVSFRDLLGLHIRDLEILSGIKELKLNYFPFSKSMFSKF